MINSIISNMKKFMTGEKVEQYDMEFLLRNHAEALAEFSILD